MASDSGLGHRLELSQTLFIVFISQGSFKVKGSLDVEKRLQLCPFTTIEDMLLCFIGINYEYIYLQY